jgi:hypothetical protein
MFERLRKLSWKRKLILALGVLTLPVVVLAQVAFITGSVFEGGQKFGVVVTFWLVLVLVAILAWRAAR